MSTITSDHFRSSNIYLAPALIAAFAIIAAAALVTVVISITTGAVPSTEAPLAVTILLFVVVVLAGACFSHHHLEIRDDHVRLIWFPAYRKTIMKSQITGIATAHASVWRNGIGLRLIGNATLALMNRGGDGVLITIKSGRSYLIVINDQQERVEALERLKSIA
jgi:hypothetical protein